MDEIVISQNELDNMSDRDLLELLYTKKMGMKSCLSAIREMLYRLYKTNNAIIKIISDIDKKETDETEVN